MHSGTTQKAANITLYLKLTAKNVAELEQRDLGIKFQANFNRFRDSYTALEQQYTAGINDQHAWATDIQTLADGLTALAS